jgi:REP element-mobilizing transposase RayT
MPHSFNKIWIHAIWSTKECQPLISHNLENKIYNFLYEEFVALGCPVRIINGIPDHIHSLFLLNPQKAVTDIVKYVKGSSSHTINKQNLIAKKFSWQTGYAAYSLNESQLERVFHYIRNQKQHHLKKTFLQEYEELLALHGLADIEPQGPTI